VYRYSAANLNQIVRDVDVAINGGSLNTAYPANSITLLVVKNGRITSNTLTLNYFTTPTPKLTWTPISWAVSYDVQISHDSGFSPIFQSANVPPSVLSFTTTMLTPGTWYWRVRAVQSSAPATPGEWSSVQSFVVAPP
jgi:hypothetical protein